MSLNWPLAGRATLRHDDMAEGPHWVLASHSSRHEVGRLHTYSIYNSDKYFCFANYNYSSPSERTHTRVVLCWCCRSGVQKDRATQGGLPAVLQQQKNHRANHCQHLPGWAFKPVQITVPPPVLMVARVGQPLQPRSSLKCVYCLLPGLVSHVFQPRWGSWESTRPAAAVSTRWQSQRL